MNQKLANIDDMVKAITPVAYERLLYVVETGRWPEGEVVPEQQRAYCQQAVMLYQQKHNHDAQHMTIDTQGEIAFKSKSELKRQFIETPITKMKV
ncbi:YeaC family protein [Vibrio gallicus]|uniref:YeaC family protein n=1 Tax=Vibrio gallicus TaxID=190897 RepID=UPI0021C28D2E|nr:DUF1315 family protein [Vibrio gallicus]